MLSDKDTCILMEKLKKALECMVYGTVEVYKIDCLSSIQVTIQSNSLIWGHTMYEFDYALYNMMFDKYVELLSMRISFYESYVCRQYLDNSTVF